MVPPGHSMVVYEDDDELVDRVASFLADGMRRGEGAVAIAAPELRSRLAAALPVDGCRLLDARETLASIRKGGSLDAEAFRREVGAVLKDANRGGKGVRAYGEMVGLLGMSGEWDDAVRLERMWNGLASTHPFALLCGYSHLSFMRAPQDAARHICVEHARTEPAAVRKALGI